MMNQVTQNKKKFCFAREACLWRLRQPRLRIRERLRHALGLSVHQGMAPKTRLIGNLHLVGGRRATTMSSAQPSTTQCPRGSVARVVPRLPPPLSCAWQGV